jgi:hypothetical protein
VPTKIYYSSRHCIINGVHFNFVVRTTTLELMFRNWVLDERVGDVQSAAASYQKISRGCAEEHPTKPPFRISRPGQQLS